MNEHPVLSDILCGFDTNCEEVRPRYYYNTVNDQNNLKPQNVKEEMHSRL